MGRRACRLRRHVQRGPVPPCRARCMSVPLTKAWRPYFESLAMLTASSISRRHDGEDGPKISSWASGHAVRRRPGEHRWLERVAVLQVSGMKFSADQQFQGLPPLRAWGLHPLRLLITGPTAVLGSAGFDERRGGVDDGRRTSPRRLFGTRSRVSLRMCPPAVQERRPELHRDCLPNDIVEEDGPGSRPRPAGPARLAAPSRMTLSNGSGPRGTRSWRHRDCNQPAIDGFAEAVHDVEDSFGTPCAVQTIQQHLGL